MTLYSGLALEREETLLTKQNASELDFSLVAAVANGNLERVKTYLTRAHLQARATLATLLQVGRVIHPFYSLLRRCLREIHTHQHCRSARSVRNVYASALIAPYRGPTLAFRRRTRQMKSLYATISNVRSRQVRPQGSHPLRSSEDASETRLAGSGD